MRGCTNDEVARTFAIVSARLLHHRVGGLAPLPCWLTTVRHMLMVGKDGDTSSTPLRRAGDRPPETASELGAPLGGLTDSPR